MNHHQGKDEVRRRRQRLDSLFLALRGSEMPGELIAHYARYMCVLVSGFAEQSMKELVAQYARKHSSPEMQRYVGKQLKRLQNIDLEKLKQLIQSFNPEWWGEVEQKYPDEIGAFGSIATVRNGISHGSDSSITLSTVKQYYDQICAVLDFLCGKFDPR